MEQVKNELNLAKTRGALIVRGSAEGRVLEEMRISPMTWSLTGRSERGLSKSVPVKDGEIILM